MKRWFHRLSESPGLTWLWHPVYRIASRATRCGLLAREPGLYRWYARIFRRRGACVVPDSRTDLVVESPGACASHAVVEYIRKHNPDIRITCYAQVPASVIYAVRHRIPAIVLTRNIMDFVASYVSRFPEVTERNAIRYYVAFYAAVMPYRRRIVIGDFQRVIHEPDALVRECNRLYGTQLNEGDGVLPRIRTQSRHVRETA